MKVILETKPLHQTKFLSLWQINYKHKDRNKEYFFASRKIDKVGPDAVIVVAFKEGKIVLTSEFRITIDSREIGFPAGLIEENEDPKKAAIREFHEETGMDFLPLEVSPTLSTSAGITNEKVCVVYGLAFGEPSKDFLEETEDIETMMLSLQELVFFMKKNQLPYDKHAWATLWAFNNLGFPHWIR